MRVHLQRHEGKAQAALDDTVTSDAEAEEEDDADSVSHLNSSGSDSSFDSPNSPRQSTLAVAAQEQQGTSSSLVHSG